jgi:hypothetical protein
MNYNPLERNREKQVARETEGPTKGFFSVLNIAKARLINKRKRRKFSKQPVEEKDPTNHIR